MEISYPLNIVVWGFPFEEFDEMARRIIQLFSIAFIFANSANAQCACDRPIPVPGQYKIVGPDFSDFFDLEVTEGPNGECGGTVAWLHPQSNAHLSCQGNQYFGTIDHMSQPVLMEGKQATPYPSLATSFTGIIQRPGLIALVPGEPFTPNFTLELVSPAAAPPCMCNEVQGWIEHLTAMQSKYADPVALEYATTNKVAGIDASKQAWPNEDMIGAYEPKQIISSTYQKSVTDQLSQTVPAGEDAITYTSNAASTDALTCEITNALPRDAQGQCRLQIIMEAIYEHESVHSQRCLALQQANDEKWAYTYWSNHPPNHSLDETQAYQATIDVLEPWHEKNCS